MEKDLYYPRLGRLDHQRPRVIDVRHARTFGWVLIYLHSVQECLFDPDKESAKTEN